MMILLTSRDHELSTCFFSGKRQTLTVTETAIRYASCCSNICQEQKSLGEEGDPLSKVVNTISQVRMSVNASIIWSFFR